MVSREEVPLEDLQQVCQFDNQQYIYEILLDLHNFEVVASSYDKNNQEMFNRYYPGASYWNKTVRQLMSELFNLENAEIQIDEEITVYLDYPVCQIPPFQFELIG